VEIPTPEQIRAERRRQHWAKRQAEQAARGPRGVTASWWDRARMVAAEEEKKGNPEAWDVLIRFLENYCQQYGQ
jgi:hypothetical protein